jgi:pimeloyl-ACP methyl ester carboxylesterase
MSLAAYQAQVDACLGHDALDRLPLITAPTLVTVGDQDILTPLRYSRLIAERIADAQLYVFSDVGHGGVFEMPGEFNRVTLDFLRTQS